MDDELAYDAVLKSVYGGLLTGDDERDAWAYREAEDLQARMVTDAIWKVATEAVMLTQQPIPREAIFHLRFGVAHRTKYIWIALRRLLDVVPPGRTESLYYEEAEALANDLNAIYINIRGALDNFAWAIRACASTCPVPSLRDKDMDLFGTRFMKVFGGEQIAELLVPFRSWYIDLKQRRDPAAHRIPLTIPHAMLDEDSEKEFVDLGAKYEAASNNAMLAASKYTAARSRPPFSIEAADEIDELFDRASTIHRERQKVGVFPGLFLHHPDEPALPIYPTVPEDVRQLGAVASAIVRHLEERTAINRHSSL